MNPGSLITMIVVLGIAWGGMLYFINIAFKAQGQDRR
ncbi:MetS family NSS transporter small subunit [Caldanaerovirga acetigignens]|nr:MetS family NSS transporter small subunit [Caldanaerovirga acetigignens]